MIVIIGLVPEDVGNALAVADPHALRVVQLAPRVGDARLRVLAHPAGAHLVRAEEPEAAGPQRDALPARDALVEVVAVAPARRAGGQRLDLARAGGLVQADLRVDRPVRVADVELVGEVVVRDGLAVRVDRRRGRGRGRAAGR